MSAFIVHKDSIDLIVTAVIMAGLHGDKDTPSAASYKAIEQADDMGQLLWQENFAAVNHLYGTEEQAPAYVWRPILELMGPDLTPEQLVQLEKTRRGIEEQSRDHASWVTSRAKRLLEELRSAIEHGLDGWPRVPRTGHPGEHDFAGINQVVDSWTRDKGFPTLARPSGQSQN